MGELSKKIGEHGEKVVLEFIKIIGWTEPADGETLQCNKPNKHARKENSPRTTHGIDLFFPHKSQLEDFTISNAIISVKYTSKPYPSPPNSMFKEHISDLSQTIECFARSELRDQSNREYEGLGIRKSNDTGILFWFSGSRDTEQDIVGKISSVILDKELDFSSIQIVDNARAAFIYNSITTVKRIYEDCELNFHYAFNSSNYTDQSIEKYGKMLPIEYLTSPILPMRLVGKSSNQQKFCISTIENFSEDAMKRLLNFASDISQDFSKEFVFIFTQYDELSDIQLVKKCIRSLGDRASLYDIKVHCSRSDFRGLVNE
ncbi:hypothetical protein RA178_09585 [Shewanella oncorhynchi]|uniref:GAPS4 PD-(D/E)XK nuclease domain-containing protein n=1 Tax=Shewanella oncorhynchi TaxID=2726434 RepID=A0AA50KH80_9GAMM|nr:hypothetical protein [Shewanella oncorhynchi]WMB74823.1 hypothetical protein RA178_09585 [Shewanella oncorhynchi]